MVSLNLMFHLTSAAVFSVLVYGLLRLQERASFHKQLWASLHIEEPRIRVTWPDQLLKRLAQAWDCAFSNNVKLLTPLRIDLKPWVEAHLALNLRSIHIENPKMIVLTVQKAGDLALWSQRLNQSMQGKFMVELNLAPVPMLTKVS